MQIIELKNYSTRLPVARPRVMTMLVRHQGAKSMPRSRNGKRRFLPKVI